MVITFSAAQSGSGPRPINPATDFPQLIELLKLVFGSEMEPDSRRMFDQAANQPSMAWRLDPVLARLTPGFVWVENGRIIGNVTLLTTLSPSRYLVANVAVHPDFRRRGIARLLMDAVDEDVRRRGGREIALQVERGNDSAQHLYETLGYATLGTMTTWRLTTSRAQDFAPREPAGEGDDVPVRELPPELWRAAFAVDQLALSPALGWPEPLRPDAYRRGILQRLNNFTSGRKAQTWATLDEKGHLTGVAASRSEWGRPHYLSVRVLPEWRGQLERPLLRRLVAHSRDLARRRIYLIHDADDPVMNELAPAAHFTPQRTLTHMRLLLD